MGYLNHNKKIIFYFIMIPIIVASTIASKKKNYNRYEYENDRKCANKCTACVLISFVFFIFIAVLI